MTTDIKTGYKSERHGEESAERDVREWEDARYDRFLVSPLNAMPARRPPGDFAAVFSLVSTLVVEPLKALP